MLLWVFLILSLFVSSENVLTQERGEPHFGENIIVLSTEKNSEESELYVTLSPLGNFVIEDIWHIERTIEDGNVYYNSYRSVTFLRDLHTNIQTPIPMSGNEYHFSNDERFLAILSSNVIKIMSTPELEEVIAVDTESPYLQPFIAWASDRNVLLIKDENEILFIDAISKQVTQQTLDDSFAGRAFNPLHTFTSQWVILPSEGNVFAVCSQTDLECVFYTAPGNQSSVTVSDDGEVMLSTISHAPQHKTEIYQWKKEDDRYILSGKPLNFPYAERDVSFNHNKKYLLTHNWDSYTIWNYQTLTPIWTVEDDQDYRFMRWIPSTEYLIAFETSYNPLEVSLEIYWTKSPQPLEKLNVTKFLNENQHEGMGWCMECLNLKSITTNGNYVHVDLYIASVIVPIEK